jgi:hypothetical protein
MLEASSTDDLRSATSSLILPPPSEPPPPPPPGRDLLSDHPSDNSTDSGRSVNLTGLNAVAACYDRVLELPRSFAFRSHRLLAANHKYRANGRVQYDRRRDYSEEAAKQTVPADDEPPEKDEVPPKGRGYLVTPAARGGFIPLDPAE